MLDKNQKLKLILFFKKGIITKNQLKSVLKIGFPLPVIFEEKPDPENLGCIYKKLGQQIIGIIF
jgi:hypothetical protein